MSTPQAAPPFPATWDFIQSHLEPAGASLASAAAMPELGEVAGGIINGKLYLVGEGSSATLAYDLATNTWTPAAWRCGLSSATTTPPR